MRTAWCCTPSTSLVLGKKRGRQCLLVCLPGGPAWARWDLCAPSAHGLSVRYRITSRCMTRALLFSADVHVVHPHIHRLGDGVPDPTPDRHPADLGTTPRLGLCAGPVDDVRVLAYFDAIDPPVRLAVGLVARVRHQHHLPPMPLAPRQGDCGQARC